MASGQGQPRGLAEHTRQEEGLVGFLLAPRVWLCIPDHHGARPLEQPSGNTSSRGPANVGSSSRSFTPGVAVASGF